MRLAWATDLHLNFTNRTVQADFLRALAAPESDALVITGDIGEAPDFDLYLANIAKAYPRPVYFVLGNHDYYRSTIAEVRDRAARIPGWLNTAGVVELAPGVGLIGHDGWADARLGRYWQSPVSLSDFILIRDFRGQDKMGRLRLMEQLGNEAAAHFRAHLPAALERYPHVIVATHVPPFREATWHEGRISDDDWLPFFSSKAAGEAIAEAAQQYPGGRVTVLCGHTHGAGETQPLPNLRVITGGAAYGKPARQATLDLKINS